VKRTSILAALEISAVHRNCLNQTMLKRIGRK